MTFTLEVDGDAPCAETVRDQLLAARPYGWTVAHAHIIDDGIARRSDYASKRP